MDEETRNRLGRKAYEAYNENRRGKTWEALAGQPTGEGVREGCRCAAEAVAGECLSPGLFDQRDGKTRYLIVVESSIAPERLCEIVERGNGFGEVLSPEDLADGERISLDIMEGVVAMEGSVRKRLGRSAPLLGLHSDAPTASSPV